MEEDRAVSAGDTEIVAIALEGGPALVVRYRDGDNEAFVGDENGVAGFSVRTGDPREVMKRVRAVAAQLVTGDLDPDIIIPVGGAAGVSVIAQFRGTSGNLLWVAEDAPDRWKPLARAAQRASFVMRPSDLRTLRDLSDEPYPGVLVSPFGEIAVREGARWTPLDELDAEDLAEEVVPRIAAHIGPNASAESVFKALLGMTEPEIARVAVFGE